MNHKYFTRAGISAFAFVAIWSGANASMASLPDVEKNKTESSAEIVCRKDGSHALKVSVSDGESHVAVLSIEGDTMDAVTSGYTSVELNALHLWSCKQQGCFSAFGRVVFDGLVIPENGRRIGGTLHLDDRPSEAISFATQITANDGNCK